MKTLDDSFMLFSQELSKFKTLNLNTIEVLAMRGVADKIYLMGKSKPNKDRNYSRKNPKILYSETYDAKTRELISCSCFSPPGGEEEYCVGVLLPAVIGGLTFACYLANKNDPLDSGGVASSTFGLTSLIFAITSAFYLTKYFIYSKGKPKRDKLRKKQEVFYKKVELLKKMQGE